MPNFHPNTIEKWKRIKARLEEGMSMPEACKGEMTPAHGYTLRRQLDPDYDKRAPRLTKKRRMEMQRIEVPVIEQLPSQNKGKVAVVIGDTSTVAALLREIM